MEDFLASGMTSEQAERLWAVSGGMSLFDYLSGIPEPLRLPDLPEYVGALGLSEFRLPMPVGSFLAAPIRRRGIGVGNVYLAKREPGEEFSREDEETLVLFALQAALVIANARRYREERRARADLETLIDTSPIGVLVFDAAAGVPVWINREARRIVSGLHGPDVRAEELLDEITVRRADGRELPLERLSIARVLRAGETVRAEEVVIGVPDGRTVTTMVNATPIRSEDGEVESFIVTLQDMAPLEETERQRSEFLGMVSRELRTPLTSIRGSASTLLDQGSSLDPAEMHQFHRIIFEQADHIHGLMSDLFDVARVETGTLSVFPGPAEVAVLVDEAKNAFLSAGGRNNLRIELPPDLPLVMADRRRTVQVVGNLLSNASRHSPESSTIRLTAVRRGVEIEVSVADDGRGIPADRLPRLFRKFSGVEAQDRGIDTGLGLAVCKGIVEAQGGRIWAESDGPGMGARFAFTIPAVEEAAFPAPGTPRLRPSTRRMRGSERPRILVVDDDPHTLRYVRGVLSKVGYTPVMTTDPEDVPRLMKEQEPCLVLLDMTLPGTNLFDLMTDVLGIVDLPVVFLSAYGQDGIIAKAFEMGAADYIVKPFSPTELTARIQAALHRQVASAYDERAEPYRLGHLMVDYAQRTATVAGRRVALTDLEYRTLAELSANAGRVVTHSQLRQRVWGLGKLGGSGPGRTIIKLLRRKLGDDAESPRYIFTAPRVGYYMEKE